MGADGISAQPSGSSNVHSINRISHCQGSPQLSRTVLPKYWLKYLERLPITRRPFVGLRDLHMSTVSSLSSSAGVTYATQLAQTSALKRSLNNLGTAVQNGDLTSAGTILGAFIKADPQYASTSSGGSQSQDPVNQDFQALADAVSNNQVGAAKNAWTQIKSVLASSGVTDLNDGVSATAKLLAQTKASIAQQILSDAFGTGSGSGISITSLLGRSSGSNNDTALSSSLLSGWLNYQKAGIPAPVGVAVSAGNKLDTTA